MSDEEPTDGPTDPGPLTGQQCTATSKGSGQQCKRFCEPGASVCHYHGGAAPQVKDKAAARVAEHELTRKLTRLGVAVETTPMEAIQRALELSAGAADVLASELAAGVSSTEDGKSGSQATATAKLFGEWVQRTAQIAKMGADAGVMERQLQIQEEERKLVGIVLREILEQLDLTPVQWEKVQPTARAVLARYTSPSLVEARIAQDG